LLLFIWFETWHILEAANQITPPLAADTHSFSYYYQLPPLPSGNYTAKIVTYDQSKTEIGCLSVQATVSDLTAQTGCGYNSSVSVQLSGTFQYPNSSSIQVGPWGPGGIKLNYPWGTFVTSSLQATPDIIGNQAIILDNYVWGLTGNLSDDSTYEGILVVAYLPDASSASNAELVQQATFSWNMNTQSFPPIFESGVINFAPKYYWPSGFPYPLALGNLNPLKVVPSSDGTLFDVSANRYWCTCDCVDPHSSSQEEAVSGHLGSGDHIGGGGQGVKKEKLPNWKLGTIIVGSVGGVILIAALIVVYFLWQNPKRPVYDDSDPTDPQKPDYGSIAINEIFEDDEGDYL